MPKRKVRKDLYIKGDCGQGYEDNRCIKCKWVGGLAIGIIACMKGLNQSKMLGRQ